MITPARAWELKKQFIDNWIAQDGLGLLNHKVQAGDRAPFPGRDLRTAGNDNGILFVTYFYFVCHAHGILDEADRVRWTRAVAGLRRKNGPVGMFDRNPGRGGHDSHDNYIAIACGSILFEEPEFTREMIDYGVRNGFTYDGENPGTVNFRRWRFGSSVGLYKYAADFFPDAVELIWLLGSFIWSAFMEKRNQASEGLMSWTMLEALKVLQSRKKKKWISLSLFQLLALLWNWRMRAKTDGIGIASMFDGYFGRRSPPNPMVELAAGL